MINWDAAKKKAEAIDARRSAKSSAGVVKSSGTYNTPVNPLLPSAKSAQPKENPIIKALSRLGERSDTTLPTAAVKQSKESGYSSTGTLGGRLRNIFAGGLKSSAADYVSAGGAVLAAKGGTEMTPIYNEQIAESMRDLEANRALLARDDLSDMERAEIQDQIKIIENRLNTYTKAYDANKETGAKLLDESSKTAQSAQESISAAKQGLGKVGSTLVDVGVAGVQMGTDAAASLLTGGAVNPLSATSARVFGSAAKAAIDNGATYEQAVNRGALAAITTYGISKLSSASSLAKKFAGQGASDTFATTVINKLADKLGKTTAGKAFIAQTGKFLASGAGEGVEEMLEDAIAPVLDAVTYQGASGLNQYADADYYADMLYDGLIGGIIGSLGGAADVAASIGKTIAKGADTNAQTPAQSTALNNTPANPLNISQESAQALQSGFKGDGGNVVSGLESANTEPSAREFSDTASQAKPVNAMQNIEENLPEGTGAASREFGYEEAQTQTHSSDPLYSEQERTQEGLRPEDRTHQKHREAAVDDEAAQRLAMDFDGEKAVLQRQQDWNDVDFAVFHGIIANEIENARESGDYSEVVKLQKVYDAHATSWGQEGHTLSRFANTPEAIIADAAVTLEDENHLRKLKPKEKAGIMETVVDRANEYNNIPEGDTAALIGLIEKNAITRKTTGLFTENVSKQVKAALDAVAKMPDGEAFLRDLASTQIRNIAGDYAKLSPLEAMKSLRYQNMLSKVSTFLRNITSNIITDPLDSLSTNIAVPLDILLSKVTGTRSMTIDSSWFSKAKRQGGKNGAIKSFLQISLDADLDSKSKYETRAGRTFKMVGNPVERFFSTWSKWQGYALQTTDEWQKGGISAEIQRGIDTLKEQGKMAADAMPGWADEMAKQRTLQNDGVFARAAMKLKEAGNQIGFKDSQSGSFGVGDIVFPFAKVPANALEMNIKYAPESIIVNGITGLGKVLMQAKNGTLTPETQAQACLDIGRGLVGTSGIALFTVLALRDWIRIAGSDDKDKDALARSEGQNGIQLNLSVAERDMNGKSTEWQDGDVLINIGYLETVNAQMATGVLLAETYKENGKISAGDFIKSHLSATVQSVLDMPALQSISDLLNGYKYSDKETEGEKAGDALIKYGASEVSSFIVPNIVRGVATGIDNTARQTYGESAAETAKNSIISGIPFARQTLPAQLDNFGDEKTYTDNPLLNALNANILPGRVDKYKTNDINQELYRLDSVYPNRKAPNSVKYDGDTLNLTPGEKAEYQKTRGKTASEVLTEVLQSGYYKKQMDDARRSQLIAEIFGFANDVAKKEYIGSGYESGKYEKVYEAQKEGIDPADYFIYKDIEKQIDNNNSLSQLENSKAVNSVPGLSNAQKGALWTINNGKESDKNPFTGALPQMGFAPARCIEIMEARSVYGKKTEFVGWLSGQGYSQNQIDAIWEVYK